MILEKIHDLPPLSDLGWVRRSTIVAIQHPCDRIYTRTTVDELCSHFGFAKDHFQSLTETDRANLCDIMWYLLGMKDAGSNTFRDQIESLRKVVENLGDKLSKR